MSRLDLIVGPNGAGTSTFVEYVLVDPRPGTVFVNTDLIAEERWPDNPQAHGYEAAGRQKTSATHSSTEGSRSSLKPLRHIRRITGRLTERAAEYAVAVLSARQLAGLCRQHARSPLGLLYYQDLFRAPGSVDTTDLDERADDLARLMMIAAQVCSTLAIETASFGRFTARDLWISLARTDAGAGSSEGEIRSLLETLASPLVGAIDGDHERGYMLATDVRVTMHRLELLGSKIAQA